MIASMLKVMGVISILSGLFQLWFGISILLGRWLFWQWLTRGGIR